MFGCMENIAYLCGVIVIKKGFEMNSIALDSNQTILLDEIKTLIPQFNDSEVVDILKSAISQIKKCTKVKQTAKTDAIIISPKIQSLIGIIPPFSQDEIEGDERLKHILND